MKNNQSYKLAIVGPTEVTQGFEALGVESVNANGIKETVEKLFELKRKTHKINNEEINMYAVIFVMEDIIQKISKEDYFKLNIGALPAIISLPGPAGSSGFGEKRLKELVERAVGQDILGD